MRNSELFSESWGEVAMRVLRRRRESGPAPELGEVEDAVRARVKVLAGLARMRPAVALRNRRDWEGRWDARAQWQRLAGALMRWGVKPVLIDGTSEFARFDAVHLGESSSLVLYRGDLQREMEALGEALAEWPMTLQDYAAISLAGELFHLLVAKAGKPPRDAWVDELAESLFVKEALGLPFSPQVFDLLRRPVAPE